MPRCLVPFLSLALVFGAVQVGSAAGSGVVEINQAAALAGGVTPGDAPGFPVSLDRFGSYVLTSDLIVPSASDTAIWVTAEDVSLDLAGFAIRGPVSCTPSAGGTACLPAGGGQGIVGDEAFTSLRNGTIVGFGGAGVELGDSARIESVTARDNGGNGIETGLFASLRDVRAIENGGAGVKLGSSGRIEWSQAFSNGARGFDVGTNVLLLRCQAAANRLAGIFGTDLIVSDSTASGNQDQGLYFRANAVIKDSLFVGNQNDGVDGLSSLSGAPPSAVVRGNVFRDNTGFGLSGVESGVVGANVASDNGHAGLACVDYVSSSGGCLFEHNVATRNGSSGIAAGREGGYVGNVTNGNSLAPATIDIQAIGENLCDESTTSCP